MAGLAYGANDSLSGDIEAVERAASGNFEGSFNNLKVRTDNSFGSSLGGNSIDGLGERKSMA